MGLTSDYRTLTFFGHAFQRVRSDLIRFRSPLLTESRLLSFPAGTEMFQFSAFALDTYAFSVKYPCGWVAPFGYPQIAAWLPAPCGFS
jgi:hypothetical protein